MFCCGICSEPVKQLLDDSEETEKWLNFEIESAVICAHCVIEGHQGGEHKIIKLPLIHRKYQSLIEFSNAQKKKMELEIQFSNLLNTLTLHKERIESYQSKISEMSKLAINSRGEANHSVVFGDFKKCLDEAETAIQTLPIHLHKDFDKKQESCEQ
uniref:Uncharacterized protein n=1 Tax=Caenorhabditis japonica TaxID=281687 RepID=A0A8R1DXJ7_CAEJA